MRVTTQVAARFAIAAAVMSAVVSGCGTSVDSAHRNAGAVGSESVASSSVQSSSSASPSAGAGSQSNDSPGPNNSPDPDSPDTAYFQVLAENGITDTGDKTVQAGKSVCDGYAKGSTGDVVLQNLESAFGYAPEEAAVIMNAATAVYCPQLKPGT